MVCVRCVLKSEIILKNESVHNPFQTKNAKGSSNCHTLSRVRRLEAADVECAGGGTEAAEAAEGGRGVAEAAGVDERARGLELGDLRGDDGLLDGDLGGARLPVEAGGADELRADVGAVEAEVLDDDGVVLVNELVDEGRDMRVVADRAARDVGQVGAEGLKAGHELVPDNGLDLDLADLGEDDTLGELGEDGELLLDDVDGLRLARDGLGEDSLRVEATTEIALAVERVEVGHAVKATPIVQREAAEAGVEAAAGERRAR